MVNCGANVPVVRLASDYLGLVRSEARREARFRHGPHPQRPERIFPGAGFPPKSSAVDARTMAPAGATSRCRDSSCWFRSNVLGAISLGDRLGAPASFITAAAPLSAPTQQTADRSGWNRA